MKHRLVTLTLLSFALFAMAAPADAGLVRRGDRFKLRLRAPANLMALRTGDTLRVLVPEGFQVIAGSPEIPPRTSGAATITIFQKGPAELKFGFSLFTFSSPAGRVSVKTQAKPDDPNTTFTVPIVKANATKKLLLPPILGAKIWKDQAPVDTTASFGVKVDEDSQW